MYLLIMRYGSQDQLEVNNKQNNPMKRCKRNMQIDIPNIANFTVEDVWLHNQGCSKVTVHRRIQDMVKTGLVVRIAHSRYARKEQLVKPMETSRMAQLEQMMENLFKAGMVAKTVNGTYVPMAI